MKTLIYPFILCSLLLSACKMAPKCADPEETKIPRPLVIGDSATITICAINPWDKTGILLDSMGLYNIRVTPADQKWQDGPNLRACNADGDTYEKNKRIQRFMRMRSAPCFALLGCINKDTSTYFLIGRSKSDYRPKKNGELVCFANDKLGQNDFWYRHNNLGTMTFVITRVK